MNLKELIEIVKSNLNILSSLDNPDFRIEQAEFFPETGNWEIIVSFLVENTNPKISSPLMAMATQFKYHRTYKKVLINNEKEIVGFFMYEKE
ncbi:hypothetical protein [Polaribacter sp. M15]